MRLRLFLLLLIGFTSLTAQIRVNVGGPQYVDTSGNIWESDTGCSSTSTYTYAGNINGTSNPTLYQTGRVATSTLNCTYSVPQNAYYMVTLKFAEYNPNITANTNGAGANPRLMNISINNVRYYTAYNVRATCGFATACDLSPNPIPVNTSAPGQISITITQQQGQPMLAALEIDTLNLPLGFLTLSGIPAIGEVPTATSTTAANWQYPCDTQTCDVNYPNNTAACAAAVAAGNSLVITVSRDLNVSCAAKMLFYPGGKIKPTTGHTATLSLFSPIAGAVGFLDLTGGGAITSSVTSPQTIQSNWFVVSGDYGARVVAASNMLVNGGGTVDAATGEVGSPLTISDGEDIFGGCAAKNCSIYLANNATPIHCTGYAHAGGSTQACIVPRSNNWLLGGYLEQDNVPDPNTSFNRMIETYPDSSSIVIDSMHIVGLVSQQAACDVGLGQQHGIITGGTHNIRITNNTITQMCGDGIDLANGSTSTSATSGEVAFNVLTNSRRDNISIDSVNGIDIHDNTSITPGADHYHGEPNACAIPNCNPITSLNLHDNLGVGDGTIAASITVGLPSEFQPISSATNANPAIFTVPLMFADTTRPVAFAGLTGGWAVLNNTTHTGTRIDSTHFSIAVDSTGFGAIGGVDRHAGWGPIDYPALFSNVLIHGNTIRQGGAISCQIPGCQIYGNHVEDSLTPGAISLKTHDGLIVGNDILWNTLPTTGNDAAITSICTPQYVAVGGQGNNLIADNHLLNATFIGIFNQGCNNAIIRGNSIQGIAPYLGDSYGIDLGGDGTYAGTGTNVIVAQNTIAGSTTTGSPIQLPLFEYGIGDGTGSNFLLDNIIQGETAACLAAGAPPLCQRYRFQTFTTLVRDPNPITFARFPGIFGSGPGYSAPGSTYYVSDGQVTTVGTSGVVTDAKCKAGGSGSIAVVITANATGTKCSNVQATPAAVITSFNTRTGAVTLTSGDVTTALGFSPVQSFNTRTGAITLTSGDVTSALGFNPATSGHATVNNTTGISVGCTGADSTHLVCTVTDPGHTHAQF